MDAAGKFYFNGQPVTFCNELKIESKFDKKKIIPPLDISLNLTPTEELKELMHKISGRNPEESIKDYFIRQCENYIKQNPKSDCRLYLDKRNGDLYFFDYTKCKTVVTLKTKSEGEK